jgi:hypothetical protein
MKKRFLTFISALFVLFLTSNCAGLKPFFQGSAPGVTSSCFKNMSQDKKQSGKYSYVPAPAEKDEMLNMDSGQYKFSVSLPATVRFQF